jgi:carbon monoxide dehydrogenase subunit G
VIELEESVVVALPRRRVFVFAGKPQNMPLWNPVVRESRAVGALKPGSEVVQRIEVLDRTFDATYRVASYEPYRRVTYTSSGGPLEIEGTMEFQTIPEGTLVRWTVRAGCRGFLRVAEGMLGSLGRPEMRTCLENLKHVLEAGDVQAPPEPWVPSSIHPTLLSRTRKLVAFASHAFAGSTH